MAINFSQLAADLVRQSRTLLPEWFPEGRIVGSEYEIGDLNGAPGHSLKINLRSGRWQDFATGDKGGDLISLYAAAHGLSQKEAAEQLGGKDYRVARAPAKTAEPQKPERVTTVARTAYSCVHPAHGHPSSIWEYLNADGQLIGYVARYDTPDGKEIVPWTYAESDGWRAKQWNEPRPLYGLRRLNVQPNDAVMIVEGEKSADAAQKFAGHVYAVITWPGGSQAWRKVDWSPIASRKILLWPDADEAGIKAMRGIAGIIDSPEIKIIDPTGQPDGWDAADSGFDWQQFRAWAAARVQIYDGGNDAGISAEVAGDQGTRDADEREHAGVAGTRERDRHAVDADVERGCDASGTRSHAEGHRERQVGDQPDGASAERNGGVEPPAHDRRPAHPEPAGQAGRGAAPARDGGGTPKRRRDATESEIIATGLKPENYEPSGVDWFKILDFGKNGPHQNLDNVVRVLANDPSINGRIWYDEFLDSIVTDWAGPKRRWRDADDVLLQLYVQRHTGLHRVGVNTVHDAALVAAFHNRKNECRDWLLSLSWDGADRLGTLLPSAFGTHQNAYTQAVGRCWITSVVARVLRPGCKVDTVPVLEGSQGAGKSTALQILGGAWFVECHESILTKDFFGVLDGHMLVEISEMHSFTRAEVERVKGLISCQVDRYRKAYGRNAEDHPRQSVLVCTTNRDDWQRDDTGARRFWPIMCGKIDHQWIRENREQLFAEAVHRFNAGESWWDVPQDLQELAVEKRRDVDAWEPVIERFLAGANTTTVGEILGQCLNIDVSKQDVVSQKRIGRILRALGWRNRVKRIGVKTIREWERVTCNSD